MKLSDKDIEKFQKLYKNRFEKEIKKEDAYKQGIKLIRLMQIVYKPITEDQFNIAEKERLKIIQSLVENELFKK